MNAKQGGIIVLAIVQIVAILLISAAMIIVSCAMSGSVSSEGMEDLIAVLSKYGSDFINLAIVVNLVSVVGYALVTLAAFRPKMVTAMEVVVVLLILPSLVDIIYAATHGYLVLPLITDLFVQVVLVVFLELIRRDFKAGRALTVADVEQMKARAAEKARAKRAISDEQATELEQDQASASEQATAPGQAVESERATAPDQATEPDQASVSDQEDFAEQASAVEQGKEDSR